jgi:CheY-like chemotaxis protein
MPEVLESHKISREPSRILVVDDDASVREMLGRVLAGEGYAVSIAADGEGALAAADRDEPDLVLLDLNLPGMSGWDVLAQLRKRKPNLPTVVITARANQAALAGARGASRLFEKPLDFPVLLGSLRQALASAASHSTP